MGVGSVSHVPHRALRCCARAMAAITSASLLTVAPAAADD